MSFDWKDYFELAKRLREELSEGEGKLNEAKRRTAISRVYYSAFCQLRDYIKGKDRYIAHEDLRDRLSNSSNPIEAEIGAYFKDLWTQRKDADYIGDIKIKNRDVDRAIEKFKAIDRAFRKLKGTH